MKSTISVPAAMICALWLGACATVAPYQPLRSGVGYSEQRLEPARYRIAFAGNSATPRETVQNYVLYRAAEVTLANGYDGFTLVTQDTQVEARGSASSFSFGFGGIGIGSRSGLGIGVGSGTGGNPEYRGSADIVMFRGSKRSDDLHAYDAREVKANLESLLVRPKS